MSWQKGKIFKEQRKIILAGSENRHVGYFEGCLYEKEFITLPRYPIYNILYTLKEDEIRAYRLRQNGAYD